MVPLAIYTNNPTQTRDTSAASPASADIYLRASSQHLFFRVAAQGAASTFPGRSLRDPSVQECVIGPTLACGMNSVVKAVLYPRRGTLGGRVAALKMVLKPGPDEAHTVAGQTQGGALSPPYVGTLAQLANETDMMRRVERLRHGGFLGDDACGNELCGAWPLMRLLRVYDSATHVLLLMELAAGGELYTRLSSHHTFPVHQSQDVAYQLLLALSILHAPRQRHLHTCMCMVGSIHDTVETYDTITHYEMNPSC